MHKICIERFAAHPAPARATTFSYAANHAAARVYVGLVTFIRPVEHRP